MPVLRISDEEAQRVAEAALANAKHGETPTDCIVMQFDSRKTTGGATQISVDAQRYTARRAIAQVYCDAPESDREADWLTYNTCGNNNCINPRCIDYVWHRNVAERERARIAEETRIRNAHRRYAWGHNYDEYKNIEHTCEDCGVSFESCDCDDIVL